MAQRVEHFNVLVAALTQLPGQTTALSFDDGIVTAFDIHIPSGHKGRTGIQLWYSGQQVIPKKHGVFFRGNNRTQHFDTEDFPAGAGWIANCFNFDVHAHTFRCTVYLDELAAAEEGLLPPIVLLPLAGA